jgi:hypothetical protein
MNIKGFLIASLFLISPLAIADNESHGFTIDDRLLDSSQKAEFSARASASLFEQLAIVESVGLPPDMLDFFKKTRIVIDPALRGNPGIFSVINGEGQVTVQPAAFPAKKPILLHELLHAYHFKIASLRNPAILAGFDAASRAGVYPPAFHRAHFLENPKEFFAVTSTIYLFGRIQQPPFDCKVLAANDPAYLAFLEKSFGRHECN